MILVSPRLLTRHRAHGFRQAKDHIKLCESIRNNDILTPLILSTDGHRALLEDGHQRLTIALELELKEVPVEIIHRTYPRIRRGLLPLFSTLADLIRGSSG